MAYVVPLPTTEPSPLATPDALFPSQAPTTVELPQQGSAYKSRPSPGAVPGFGSSSSATGTADPIVIRPSGRERAVGVFVGAFVLFLVLGIVFGCVLAPRLMRKRRRRRAAYQAEYARASTFGVGGREASTRTEGTAPFDDRDHDPSLAALPV